MSYAAAASRGPKQTPEEAWVSPNLPRNPALRKDFVSHNPVDPSWKSSNVYHSRAPPPPQIEQRDIDTHPTVDVDGSHIHSVPNDYKGETDTQMHRLEQEAEQEEEAAIARFHEASQSAHKEFNQAKSTAAKKGKEAKASAKHASVSLRENRDNPVVIGNAVVWATIAAALGFGAYRQHQEGSLNWKVAGAWAGVVGLFATGDYLVSQWLFQNKYPRK